MCTKLDVSEWPASSLTGSLSESDVVTLSKSVGVSNPCRGPGLLTPRSCSGSDGMLLELVWPPVFDDANGLLAG